MNQQALVLFQELACASGKRIGIAQLNSEKSLNSLNLAMIQLLTPQLQAWAKDEGIVAVFLHSAGEKAFCAGGDVKQICLAVRANGIDDSSAVDFFSAEYRLDYLIHQYPKPLIVWATGFSMGGGIGLLAGASHRIVTETSRLAMPEISIGLYPDVGGSWLLSRLGKVGLFLGMTGAQINAADALSTQFASHALASGTRHDVMNALTQMDWDEDTQAHHHQISQLLMRYQLSDLAQGQLDIAAADIEQRTSATDLAQLYQQLIQPSDNPWLHKAAMTLKRGSPTSAALIYRQWQNGKDLSLAECFKQELTLSVQCARHPDFIEGVRALLVDKDQNPQWQAATIAQVTEAYVEEHYKRLWRKHPLADLK
ncbi:MAG: enoyl-CoA hydratase/isomerase family protein [Moraxellaceae bacterium]|nr:enoyl-CoA hydratase/isomerase family protein [Moraxellaceae bacterium]